METRRQSRHGVPIATRVVRGAKEAEIERCSNCARHEAGMDKWPVDVMTAAPATLRTTR